MEHNVKESKTSALMYIIYGLESIPAAFGLLVALVYLNESLFASFWFLISAILISPLPLILQNKVKIVKSKVLMIALQVFVSFIVFCIGIANTPSTPKEPEPEIARTVLESESTDTSEYETEKNSTELAETSTQTETTTVSITESTKESEIKHVSKDNLIDGFIKRFNHISEDNAENPLKIDIQSTEYYRTEFRLSGFKSANARRYDYKSFHFIIIEYGGHDKPQNNHDLRIYLSCNNIDECYQFLEHCTKILVPNYTDKDLTQIKDSLYSDYSQSDVIGSNFRFYYDKSRNDLMIDNSNTSKVFESNPILYDSEETSQNVSESLITEDSTTEATTIVEPTTLPPTTEPPMPPPTVPLTFPPTERITAPPAPPRQVSQSFVLNTNTMKFHYPSCSSVKDIAPENYATYEGTADEVIQKGYQPCKRCNPH